MGHNTDPKTPAPDPCALIDVHHRGVAPGRRPKLPTVGEAKESWASSDAVRASMQANRSRDTAPELALRRAVHALGLRYRVAARPLPAVRRTADLVFSKAKVAVFMDGCFWHGCPVHHTVAVRNGQYWADKVERNRRRDSDTDQRLAAEGWVALRVWEHEAPEEAAQRVRAVVEERRPREDRRRGKGVSS
jgi:DNA mismatch endonuclease (patch repair protein)